MGEWSEVSIIYGTELVRSRRVETDGEIHSIKYPKDAMYGCPECLRHYLGGMALRVYEGRCDLCNAEIDPKADRVK